MQCSDCPPVMWCQLAFKHNCRGVGPHCADRKSFRWYSYYLRSALAACPDGRRFLTAVISERLTPALLTCGSVPTERKRRMLWNSHQFLSSWAGGLNRWSSCATLAQHRSDLSGVRASNKPGAVRAGSRFNGCMAANAGRCPRKNEVNARNGDHWRPTNWHH